jgi:uncharacterized protein with PIN domain
VNTGASAPKFIADHMLGSLARWLRMMGYDTVYDKSMDDPDIAKLARSESRFILTRDKELSKEPAALLLENEDLDSQLQAVATRYGLKFNEGMIRCSTCNGDLADLPKDEAKDKVPEGAFKMNERFWKCTKCQKIYWKGTHWDGISTRLKKLNLA